MKTLTEHNRETYKKIKRNAANVLCDTCGNEMEYTNPGQMLMSFPPKMEVHCSNCGATGYKVQIDE